MPKHPKGLRGPTQAEKRKIRDAEYRKDRDALIEIGAYAPKSKKLTKHRKTTINKLAKQFRGVISRRDEFIVTPLSTYVDQATHKRKRTSAKQRRELHDRAETLLSGVQPKHAIITAKEGYTHSFIVRDKEGEFAIMGTGKTKRGENKGKRYTRLISSLTADELSMNRHKLQAQIDTLGPLKEGQSYVFKVEEFGKQTGYSNQAFHGDNAVDKLFKYLYSYRKDEGKLSAFLRLVTIEKHDPQIWFDEHRPAWRNMRGPAKKAWLKANKKGRSSETKRPQKRRS